MKLALFLMAALVAGAAALDASIEAPGGLTPSNTPQFVLFTHDDAIGDSTHHAMLSVTDGVTANGCPAAATMFTLKSGTDCELVWDLYDKGYEIADHTMTHRSFLDQDKRSIEKEIVGCRDWLADTCGIPKEDIVGLRSPYLETKGEVFDVLAENDFLYDSTLIEEGTGNSITRGMDERVFPFTLDDGVPINCGWFSGIQKCGGVRHEGLWEIPVWDLTAERGAYTMDYGDNCGGDGDCVYRILKKNFEKAYEGNRAPFPIFIHTPWLKANNHLDQLQRFVNEVAAMDNVYFITMRQLIAWMQNPIGLDELTPEKLGCGNKGGAGPTAEQLASGSGELSWSEEGAVGPVNEYRMDGGLDAAPAPSPAAWGFEAEGAFDMDAPEPLEAEQIMTGETQQQA